MNSSSFSLDKAYTGTSYNRIIQSTTENTLVFSLCLNSTLTSSNTMVKMPSQILYWSITWYKSLFTSHRSNNIHIQEDFTSQNNQICRNHVFDDLQSVHISAQVILTDELYGIRITINIESRQNKKYPSIQEWTSFSIVISNTM